MGLRRPQTCPEFTFKDVHANKTATETDTYAVNNAGVIAGDYIDSAGIQHAMILDGKKLTTVDHKDCATTGGIDYAIAFYGINSAGTVSGQCMNTKTHRYEGFIYDKETKQFTPISFPNSTGTAAYGINDKEEVVGFYVDPNGYQHGFVKKGNKYTSIDVPGGTTWAAGINNIGWITVFSNTTTGLAYLKKPGKKLIPITDPNDGSNGNNVRAINNKGDIDGVYWDSSNNRVGFLWMYKTKTFCDVRDPKADNSTRAVGLNDQLEIVGRYSPLPGTANVGFKAVPKATYEPEMEEDR